MLAFRLWFLTWLVFSTGVLIYALCNDILVALMILIISSIGAALVSSPVLLIYWLTLRHLEKVHISSKEKVNSLYLVNFCLATCYGILLCGILELWSISFPQHVSFLLASVMATCILFACSCLSLLFSQQKIRAFFSHPGTLLPAGEVYQEQPFEQPIPNETKTETYMDTYPEISPITPSSKSSDKIIIKAIITGVLILVMLIPTVFVTNLINERETRQKEVVQEVTSKWASDQTLTGPYLYIPYMVKETDSKGNIVAVQKHFFCLPENLQVTGTVTPEIRPRSIYKVLLYKSSLESKGNFTIHLPKDIDPASLQLSDAKICLGLTDFKGIEEKLSIDYNGTPYEFSPGLPSNDIDSNGLSVPIALIATDLDKNLSFQMKLQLKGSELLHFVPLGGDSRFQLQSSWNSPSFDGNTLPSERTVNEKGFSAQWICNKANLPFGTLIKDFKFNKESIAFGVTMLQPADQYAKTSRSIKYAILLVGLTFSLFFIIELLQKKPMHPVQYMLVGLALVVFYTLLLSISEFLLFNEAYLIASLAIVILVTSYAQAHFKNWKTTSLFAGILGCLYGFIFILIQLEDSALLIGSVGLFIILALVMFASRKVNWYGTHPAQQQQE